MFRQHARLSTIIQFASDVLLSCLAFVLAYWTRLHLETVTPSRIAGLLNPELYPLPSYGWLVGLALLSWALVASSLGLYKLSIRRSDWEKIRIILASAVVLGLFLGFLSFATKLILSRSLTALFVLFQVVLLSLARFALKIHVQRGAHPSRSRRNILIVGAGEKAREMGRVVSCYSDWGLRILGYIAGDGDEDVDSDLPVMGTIADIPEIIENNVVDEIIFVGRKASDLERLGEILGFCKEQGVRTSVVLDFFPAKASNVSMEFLENVPLLTFSTTPDHAGALLVKRIMDIVLSSILLVLLAPFILIVAIAIKMTSNGSVFYKQVRCGLYGRRFVLYKFRSMKEGADDVLWEIKHLNEMDGPVFKMRNDPRVTALGKYLRRSSIDEIPQFWNVLKGDMSLVGPRAPLLEEVKEYSRWQRRRLSVKPGITCLWQVSGRNEIDFHEWMKLDLHYIDNWSLLLDLKILLRTFPVVLLGKGAR